MNTTDRERAGTLLALSQAIGLHPLVGFGLFAADWMLFGGETATLGISLGVSLAVSLVLGLASILIQRSSFGDSWMAAIGKGLIVGALTAIPTPLPSIVTFTTGVLGSSKLLMERKQ